jgi:hypothetical protein
MAAQTAGAGRGKQGGPTAKQLADYERKQNAGIYTAEMGQPPMDPEVAKKHGGMITKYPHGSGAEQRGKTKGRFV